MISSRSFALVFMLSIGFLLSLKAYNQLTVADVRFANYVRSGSIDSAFLVVKSKGLYTEQSMYLTISARGQGFKATDSLEISYRFDLPAGAIVTDTWLWLDENTISKGKLYDKWTASGIYENIVKRRRDPSLLFKESATQYLLKIFPMSGTGSRKIKITYLIPSSISIDKFSTKLISNYLNVGSVKVDFLKVVYFQETNFVSPVLVNTKGEAISLFKKYEPSGNVYYNGVCLYKDYIEDMDFEVQVFNPSPIIFSVFERNGEKYYQLAIQPNSFLDSKPTQSLLICLDLDMSNVVGKAPVFSNLISNLKKELGENDAFNVSFTKGFQYQLYSTQWMKSSDDKIEEVFTSISNQISSISSSALLMNESLNWIINSSSNGRVLLVTSGSGFHNFNSANLLIEALKSAGLERMPFHIADVSSVNVNCSNYGTQYFCNNQYLLTNLARISKGSSNVFLGGQQSLNNMIGTAVVNSVPVLTNPQIYPKPQNGYTYSRYHPVQYDKLGLNEFMIQFGKFKGELPFTLDVTGEAEGKVYNKFLVIDSSALTPRDGTVEQIWADYQIKYYELAGSKNQARISDAISLSIDSRVLGLYTAFLCLEDSSFFCPNCIDESKTSTGTKNSSEDDKFIVSPNPFWDQIHIELNPGSGHSNELPLIQIYDLQGKIVYQTKDGSWSGDVLSFDLNVTELKAGMYILVIKLNDKVFKKKIIKL
ncbi:MAG: T9SS type A sorting domain-containing protein [Saprospiraceae bacterium]|nr:T9SS type A sorting domain-containing protein [Candidatus Vicinibacter affinis]